MQKKILIVEDTPDLLENVVEFLTLENYEVVPAETAEEALNTLSIYIPDLIITDLLMRGLDGYGFLERLKKNPAYSNIPVIVFSAKPREECEATVLALGAKSYLKKPTTLENLLQAVQEVVGN